MRTNSRAGTHAHTHIHTHTHTHTERERHTHTHTHEPALGDGNLTNAHELEDRVAVAKRGEKKGGKAFVDTALRVQKAGARALVIINSTDELVSKSSLTLSLARSLALVRSLSRALSNSLSRTHKHTHIHTHRSRAIAAEMRTW